MIYFAFQFTDNGVIVLLDSGSAEYSYPSTYSQMFDLNLDNKAIISPFWADVKASLLTGMDNNVFYQVSSCINIIIINM